MKSRDLALVGLRLVAVYLGVVGMGALVPLGDLLLSNPMTPFGNLMLSAVMMLTPAAVAILLWVLAPRLAVIATRECSEPSAGNRLSVHDLTSCGLIIAGAFLFVGAFPHLVTQLLRLGSEEYGVSASWIVTEALTCALAIALVVGAKQIANATLLLRRAGSSK